MNELIAVRDRLQLLVDQAMQFRSEAPDEQHWDSMHLAALAEAWMILDQEVTRLSVPKEVKQ